MTPEIKAEWIKRLSSGDYIPTRGKLNRGLTDDGKKQMCCLGVLCDILVEKKPTDFKWGASATDTCSRATPLEYLDRWRGMSSAIDWLPAEVFLEEFDLETDIQRKLAHINDGAVTHAMEQNSIPTYADVLSAIEQHVETTKVSTNGL